MDDIHYQYAQDLDVQVRRKGPRKCRHACCACILVLAITVSVLVFGAAIKRYRRISKLEPLLDEIDKSLVCEHKATDSCMLELSPRDSTKFDLHPAENSLFGFLFAQVARRDRTVMSEVLQGAHLVLPLDQGPSGDYYDFLRRLPGAHERISSHQSDRTQYGIPEGSVVSTLLIGSVQGRVWLQLEGSVWDPFHVPLSSVCHVIDYIQYKLTGRNVGPLGSSSHTDKNPLLVEDPILPEEACPESCLGEPRRQDWTFLRVWSH